MRKLIKEEYKKLMETFPSGKNVPKVKVGDTIEFYEWRTGKMEKAKVLSIDTHDGIVPIFYYPAIKDDHGAFWNEEDNRWESTEI